MKKIILVLLLLILFCDKTGVANTGKGNSLYISGNYIQAGFTYGSKQMMIRFNKCGRNSLMALSRVSTKDSSGLYNTLIDATSDWIGPYTVSADSNGNNNKPSFTGGWHGYNEDGTGSPTAKTESYYVLADGKKIEKSDMNRFIDCNEATIQVNNLIQGYNTKKPDGSGRFILHEQVNYRVRNSCISVSVAIKALENITIEKYYGLQTQNKAWRDSVEYVSRNNKGSYVYEKYNGYKCSQPLNNAFEYMLISKQHVLIATLNKKAGLGTGNYVLKNQPAAFTMDYRYGKTYFNLVNGVKCRIKKNGIKKWFGSYVFKPASNR